jgi:hypothetical protein
LREENRLRVLRKIFVSKLDEVTGEWRRLHVEELRGLYPSHYISRVIKSSRVRYARHCGGNER